jgi:hypothetical protein
MKNIIILFLVFLFPLSSTYAEVEDTSIIDELEKQEVKQIDFDFNLKSFESCQNLEDVM